MTLVVSRDCSVIYIQFIYMIYMFHSNITSASEYLRCAPKYTISRLNNQNFYGEGNSPSQTPPRGKGDTPPRTLPPSAPSALVPPLKNPGYAPAFLVGGLV